MQYSEMHLGALGGVWRTRLVHQQVRGRQRWGPVRAPRNMHAAAAWQCYSTEACGRFASFFAHATVAIMMYGFACCRCCKSWLVTEGWSAFE